MPLLLQHILALLIAAVCASVLLYHLVQTFRHKPSRLGACCAKGCPPADAAGRADRRIAFVPVEALRTPRSSAGPGGFQAGQTTD